MHFFHRVTISVAIAGSFFSTCAGGADLASLLEDFGALTDAPGEGAPRSALLGIRTVSGVAGGAGLDGGINSFGASFPLAPCVGAAGFGAAGADTIGANGAGSSADSSGVEAKPSGRFGTSERGATTA
jgi:hypothetical protein